MSSIIVLDSSDEEADGTSGKKKNRIQQGARPLQQPMARVNPVKATNATAKKPTAMPSENYKIQLPSKRPIPVDSEPSAETLPEKRIRRVKPTTVVRSNDEEWINRQPLKNGEQAKSNQLPTPMLNKSIVNSVKAPMKVVKSPVASAGPLRNLKNPTRVVVSPVPEKNAKAPMSYVRFAWNGKDPKPSSPPTVGKNINLKEQPSPPPNAIINRTMAASVKDTTKVVSLSPPIFNKNSVTIRRVLVNEERLKTLPTTKTNTPPVDPLKVTNVSATTIRKLPMNTDPLKITKLPAPVKTYNASAVTVTQVNVGASGLNTLTTSIRKVTVPMTNTTPLAIPVAKRNATIIRANDSAVVATSTPSSACVNPLAIKRVVSVDMAKTSASPSVVSKAISSAGKGTVNDQRKSSMTMSVITKNHAGKVPEMKMSPPVPKPPATIMTRPSGLIVTAVTCAAVTTPAATLPVKSVVSMAGRGAGKQTKQTLNNNRVKAAAAPKEQVSGSMFNMFPPSSSLAGGPQMMYDMNPTSGSFINPAYTPNRQVRQLESPNFTAMPPSSFNMAYSNFSGGSITPVLNTGTPSPTYNSGRSSKSPVTSTVTRSSSAVRSPAAFMGGTPIDVDQPQTPMSPTVFNMNNPPFNGDPFNFMRSPHTIPSPAYSPVRSTKSPTTTKGPVINLTNDSGPSPTSASVSPAFHRDLDSFVKNPYSYPRTTSSTVTTNNGPIISVVDSPVRNHHPATGSPTGFFKSPTSTITSPAHSIISDGSSMSECGNAQPPNGDDRSKEDKGKLPTADAKAETVEDEPKEEEKEPLNPEFETLLKACREADSSEDMNKLIESKLVRYYYSVHPDFVKSRGFRKAVVGATEAIKKNSDLVYYHLRPVVEEMKARKKSKAVVMTSDEPSAAASVATSEADEGIEDKVRNRQIRRLNKGLYILTRKIHKLENEEVDLDDENSTYLIVERYKKRACEIYDKICDLTGESKHALRQVKKPITFKGTQYPRFNKVLETFVNRTKEFPDFVDVLRMLEFCNDKYILGLVKDEMTTIAQDAFIKIGKLLQSRRKADLYETVSHFTSDIEDPAANDPALLAKLSENEKKKTSIGSIINKYAREQVRRKADSADELNNTSESGESDAQSCDEEEPSNNNNTKKKPESKTKDPIDAKTNGTNSPDSSSLLIPMSSSTPPPAVSSSAAFRTSPPHAFASPQASPRPRSPSPLHLSPLPPSSQQAITTSSLKILSVTSLNESAIGKRAVTDKTPAVDEIVISDEDL